MSQIVDFYLGEGKDSEFRTLEDIWKFNYGQLEMTHDYIQWLFPTQQPSNFNEYAPLLTEEDIQQFKANPKLRENLLYSFYKMLHFFGLECFDGFEDVEPLILRGDNYEQQKPVIFGEYNHNHWRVTRILTCLTLCGLKRHAEALLRCLREHAKVSENTLGHWERAVQ